MLDYLETTMPGSLLRIADLDSEQLDELLDVAEHIKREPDKWGRNHGAGVLACCFAKPATRAHLSLQAAAWRLGMLPVTLAPEGLQLGRDGSVGDTARDLSACASAIAISMIGQRDVQGLADAASVPVINACTDDHDPCQALADLLTLRERFGRMLTGMKLAYIGGGNGVAQSLMEAGALAGMHVVIAVPRGHEPEVSVSVEAHDLAHRLGGSVEVTTDVERAATNAQAVYTDTWASIGGDSARGQRPVDLSGYQVNEALMARAEPDAVFMHPLPARRGQEVTSEVIDGPQSLAIEQAANKVPIAMAVIHALLSSRATGA